jgi:hypothetical protein
MIMNIFRCNLFLMQEYQHIDIFHLFFDAIRASIQYSSKITLISYEICIKILLKCNHKRKSYHQHYNK